jgi:hypothetical protein
VNQQDFFSRGLIVCAAGFWCLRIHCIAVYALAVCRSQAVGAVCATPYCGPCNLTHKCSLGHLHLRLSGIFIVVAAFLPHSVNGYARLLFTSRINALLARNPFQFACTFCSALNQVRIVWSVNVCACPGVFPNTVRLFCGLWVFCSQSPWTSRAAGSLGARVGLGLAPCLRLWVCVQPRM